MRTRFALIAVLMAGQLVPAAPVSAQRRVVTETYLGCPAGFGMVTAPDPRPASPPLHPMLQRSEPRLAVECIGWEIAAPPVCPGGSAPKPGAGRDTCSTLPVQVSPNSGSRQQGQTDGTSNTIAIGETAPQTASPGASSTSPKSGVMSVSTTQGTTGTNSGTDGSSNTVVVGELASASSIGSAAATSSASSKSGVIITSATPGPASTNSGTATSLPASPPRPGITDGTSNTVVVGETSASGSSGTSGSNRTSGAGFAAAPSPVFPTCTAPAEAVIDPAGRIADVCVLRVVALPADRVSVTR